MLPDLELFDGEVAPEVHDEVHHLGQDHRIDDVTGEHETRLVALLAHRSAPAAALMSSRSLAASCQGLSA